MGLPASGARHSAISPLLIHLRLHFQLLLAPVFLWGYALAGGGFTLRGLAVFTAFHIFGYGGGTALNSYYDRDEGPIGGLAVPPPVVPALLPFSLVWQALGFGIVLGIDVALALIYALMFLLSLAYSHPLTRWKSRTWTALLTVALGQGLLAFGAGWLAAAPGLAGLSQPVGRLGAVAAALLVTGFYPLSQLYQLEEDRRRGDRTLAVRYGVRAAMIVSAGLSILGLAGLLGAATWRFGPVDGFLLFLGYACYAVWLGRQAGKLLAGHLPVMEQYRLIMRAALVNAAGLWLYLFARILLNWRTPG